MDHLTGFSREGVPDSDPEFGATFRRTSKPDSEVVDGALTNLRNAARPMLPVTERKPGRATPLAEATALSYEKALRIHGRRRDPPAAPVVRTAPALPTQQIAAAIRVDPVIGSRKTAAPAKAVAGPVKASEEHPKVDASPVRSGARSNLPVPRGAKRQVSPPIQVESSARHKLATPEIVAKANLTASHRRKNTAAASSVSKPAEKTAPHLPAHEAEVRAASKTRRRGKSSGKVRGQVHEQATAVPSRPDVLQNRAAKRGTTGGQAYPLQSAIEVMDAESPGSQLELLQAFGQLDQRRTIVSVRLTEGEFACLRDRAEESGISVSAYMRSCVVDAEQLRAQVKRALAEMRSLSASTDGAPGIALAASNRKTGDSNGWNTHDWFRLALRPLVFLFGPLFSARRSA